LKSGSNISDRKTGRKLAKRIYPGQPGSYGDKGHLSPLSAQDFHDFSLEQRFAKGFGGPGVIHPEDEQPSFPTPPSLPYRVRP
jgi:hypothetical protein